MGGSLALIIRLELFLPGSQFIADSMTFNRIFTVHGTTLIFLFILPFASAVGNYFVPIMIRYKDMAYPKLNAIAFWMIPPAGALIWLGFADFTWYATPPYSIISAPGPAADMWIFGLKNWAYSSLRTQIQNSYCIQFKVKILELSRTSFRLQVLLARRLRGGM